MSKCECRWKTCRSFEESTSANKIRARFGVLLAFNNNSWLMVNRLCVCLCWVLSRSNYFSPVFAGCYHGQIVFHLSLLGVITVKLFFTCLCWVLSRSNCFSPVFAMCYHGQIFFHLSLLGVITNRTNYQK